ncbi:PHA/PHB synthase family protein [Halocatena salina]|uniref:Alpha/beta fold hydrolase n=1 Tax=Halocatena salina TaxID=2934340 RepID=A0A8U0A2J8_9EURY|nr:alpha/beta fold hydrolase [Halocatena salina]UPM42658.1 alpha/beta fold hydrolase [Halocatena salina]
MNDRSSHSNPLALALDAQRQRLTTAIEAVETLDVGPLTRDIATDVGRTPSEVIYSDHLFELHHYEPRESCHDIPILFVYSLINKPFILDLQPDRSVVQRLLEAGFHVYMIGWNEPPRERRLTLDEYVNECIGNCVDVVRERSGQESINMMGYCIGGTMAAIYAALHPDSVLNLGLIAAGLCFETDDPGGVFERWNEKAWVSPREITEAYENVPSELLALALSDPNSDYVSKFARLYDNRNDDAFVATFARIERWLADGVDVAAEPFSQFIEDICRKNKICRNELSIGDEHVEFSHIDMPVLQLTARDDHLFPPETSKPFTDVIASTDTRVVEFPTGHIGLLVSERSHESVWPEVCAWFGQRS